jgi:hypothetical protein
MASAAAQFLSEVEEALAAVRKPERPPTPTSYRDPTDVPAIGTAPPIAQPGRPPMSQRAVDLNTTLISTSVVIAVTGGSISAVLCASSIANTTVIAWICVGVVAVPVVLALPFLALKSLMKSAKEVVKAAPPVIHQHYSGQITQNRNTINADTRGLIAVTRNQLPPAR